MHSLAFFARFFGAAADAGVAGGRFFNFSTT
jgi:hypothetical protein